MKRVQVTRELQCNVCHIACAKKCSKCNTFYCSIEHQTQDWAQHKTSDMHLGGGAYVFPPSEPVCGDSDSISFDPVAYLSHSNLYPSVMKWHKRVPDYSLDAMLFSPLYDRMGLTPKHVNEILKERKAHNHSHDDRSKSGSPLDGKQLALKISANAAYGLAKYPHRQRPRDMRDDKGNFSD